MRVQVYYNLNTHTFSVVALEGKYKGKVCGYSDHVRLKDATFAVQPAGRERVLKEKRKNVHAFVRGELMSWDEERIPQDFVPVTYNPYKYDSFVMVENESPVKKAKHAYLENRRIWVDKPDGS